MIGPSIQIDGTLRGDEDLVIEGRVKGTVELSNNSVTIGSQGHVQADIFAHTIYVEGKMDGQLVASEQVVIRKSARVKGSIAAPRVSLEDGAQFNGTIDMDSSSELFRQPKAVAAEPASASPAEVKPAKSGKGMSH